MSKINNCREGPTCVGGCGKNQVTIAVNRMANLAERLLGAHKDCSTWDDGGNLITLVLKAISKRF